MVWGQGNRYRDGSYRLIYLVVRSSRTGAPAKEVVIGRQFINLCQLLVNQRDLGPKTTETCQLYSDLDTFSEITPF